MRYAPTVAPRPHRRVVESPLGRDLALFHLDTRRLHVLNGSAAAIWRQLHEAGTVGDVAVGLGDEFDVSPMEIRSDVERAIEQMRADGLLQMDDRPVASPAAPTRRATASSAVSAGVDVPVAGSFAALDARVAVVCPDAEMSAAIATVLAPLQCDDQPDVVITVSTAEPDMWELSVGDSPPLTLGSRLSVVLRVLGEVNNLAVESSPTDLVFHAGAVALDGRGVLLPGGSNHGKSTLTTALVADGFSYLTDEAAAVTADLMIRPFAKSIALDPGSFPLFAELAPTDSGAGLARAIACREWHIDPARVGTVAGPVPVAAVVCPQWRAGATTRVGEVDVVEALHLLLGDAFDFAAGGQPVFERLVEVVSSVPVLRVTYGETADAIDAVRSVLASR
jgi:hypothetical protein